jgi:hypothetical protein
MTTSLLKIAEIAIYNYVPSSPSLYLFIYESKTVTKVTEAHAVTQMPNEAIEQ